MTFSPQNEPINFSKKLFFLSKINVTAVYVIYSNFSFSLSFKSSFPSPPSPSYHSTLQSVAEPVVNEPVKEPFQR
jgi:hypothetical protein